MTEFPCLADTDTVLQSITEAGYQADLVIDPDSTNGITVDGAGLSVKYGVAHAARIANPNAQVFTQGVANATAITFAAIRFDTTGLIAGVVANQLVPDVPGLWMFGAHCGVTEPTFFGVNYSFELVSASLGVIGYDQCYTGQAGANYGVAETGILCGNPVAIVETPGGAIGAVGLTVLMDETAAMVNAPQTTPSSGPPTAVAGRNEMAGTEMWCALLKAYEV